VSLEKPLNQYLIFRWAAHCLALPATSPLLPLFWQQLAVLLLARVPARAAGGMAPTYGMRFFHGREEQLTALKKRYVSHAPIAQRGRVVQAALTLCACHLARGGSRLVELSQHFARLADGEPNSNADGGKYIDPLMAHRLHEVGRGQAWLKCVDAGADRSAMASCSRLARSTTRPCTTG